MVYGFSQEGEGLVRVSLVQRNATQIVFRHGSIRVIGAGNAALNIQSLPLQFLFS